MSSTRHRRRIRKAIARRGQPVELTLYEVVSGGAMGDFAEELTTVETRAIVDTGGTVESQVERDFVFTDVNSDVVVYLRDDVTEEMRAENYDGEMVRPVITSVDTTFPEAATELRLLNSGPMNRSRAFQFKQAHDWSDAGCIVAAAVLE